MSQPTSAIKPAMGVTCSARPSDLAQLAITAMGDLNRKGAYIFFSEHTFFAASQVPPAFSQSAGFFAAVNPRQMRASQNQVREPERVRKEKFSRRLLLQVTPT